MEITIASAFQNALWFSLPALFYAIFVRLRHKLSFAEISRRLGLSIGEIQWYGIAILASLPLCLLTAWLADLTKNFEGSMTAQFAGQPPSFEFISAALLYGFIATGIPEEFLFRGLIAGALFRRFRFWTANVIQSVLFLIPHLLILFVAPELWWLATTLPFFLGLLTGYLRNKSDSFGPSVIVHALPNAIGAISLLRWG